MDRQFYDEVFMAEYDEWLRGQDEDRIGVIEGTLSQEPNWKAGEGIESTDTVPPRGETELLDMWGVASPQDDPPGLCRSCGPDRQAT